ncbi:unnamed protein product [Rhizophagus irregularis]|nr:unnamed protein product [Rhizophagus irregularis]
MTTPLIDPDSFLNLINLQHLEIINHNGRIKETDFERTTNILPSVFRRVECQKWASVFRFVRAAKCSYAKISIRAYKCSYGKFGVRAYKCSYGRISHKSSINALMEEFPIRAV